MTDVKKQHLLSGHHPPQWLSVTEMADAARRASYQPSLLARELGLTPRTFERRFQKAFDCAPREWLEQEQMREAAALLAQGRNTKEVAALLGYRHAPSFLRGFRRLFGCTTREWQRQLEATTDCPPGVSGGRLSRNAIFLSANASSPGLRFAGVV